MEKNNYQFVTAILLGTITFMSIVLTSCSDDRNDEDTASVTKQTAASNNSLSGFYSYSDETDGSVSLQVNGNDVIASRNGSVNGAVNGKLVYDNNSSGTLEMSDSTFSTKKIPFVMGAGMIRLDFNGTGDFSGNSVFLKRTMATRSSKDDLLPGVISNDAAKSLFLKTGKTLLEKGAKALLGDLGSDLTTPLIDLIYPSDGNSESAEAKQLKDIEDDLVNMEAHITNFQYMYHRNDLLKTYKDHWEIINSLRNNIKVSKSAIKNAKNNDERLKEIDNYANCVINKNTLRGYLLTMIKQYQNTYGNEHTVFENLDEYLITSYPFLSQSTCERLLYREEDLATLTEATGLMIDYCHEHNMEDIASDYATALDSLYKYFEDNSDFDPHEGEIICTLKDAYCVMSSETGIKKFGETEFSYEQPNMRKIDYYDQAMDDREWADSYVFSIHGAKTHQTELKTMCLTPKEAQTIVNYYGGNRNLFDILTNAGLTGLDDNNAVMLLGDWSYPDNHSWLGYCDIMARVWNGKTNKYDSNYKVDQIRHRGFLNWDGHMDNSWAYYTYVSKHFTGKNAYDDFIAYANERPADKARTWAWISKILKVKNPYLRNN